jgi:PAS domain S-box-containing protein
LSESSANPVPVVAPGGVAPRLDAATWLAAIVESSDDAMTGKTLDGVITSWNSAAERLYGYGAGEILGRNVSVLIPPDRPDELAPILERVANGGHVEKYETQRLRKDGTIVDVSITISPIRDATNTIVGASTVARDVSDRNRAATELLALQERLNQAQRLESLGQLAGGIAHDFNNLLAGIMNYAALASDGLETLTTRLGLAEDEDAATLSGDLAEITVVATRAAQLTRQLLIFSRREVARAEVIDLNAIVTDMEKLLGQALGEAIELVTDLAPDLPRTNVDRGQIEQVLMNLVVNARDAMPRGGRLRIETVRCEADGDWARQKGGGPHHCACLTVSDNGCGMAPDVRARAFEPFFTTKAKGEGSGLGLATVYGIVTQAGGGVVVSSELGLGTTVRVEIPATEDVAGPAQEVLPGKPTTSLGETILLVEDEDIVREPTKRILARNGYTVLSAPNADEALQLAHEHTGTIGLLLTDVVMPGRSGKDLAAVLRRLRPETRVLYMSGYNQEVAIHEDALAGGLNLIEKPFIAVDLLRAIRRILDSG